MIVLSSAIPSAAQREILLGSGCNSTLTAPSAVCTSHHPAAHGNLLGGVLVRKKILKEGFILFAPFLLLLHGDWDELTALFFNEQPTEMSVQLKAGVAAVAGSGAAQNGTAGSLCNRLCSCSPACTFIPQNPTVFQLQIEFWHRDALLLMWEGKSSVLLIPGHFPLLHLEFKCSWMEVLQSLWASVYFTWWEEDQLTLISWG